MEDCVICMNETLRLHRSFECRHLFCRSCVKRLRRMDSCCPLCRSQQRGLRIKLTVGSRVYHFTLSAQ